MTPPAPAPVVPGTAPAPGPRRVPLSMTQKTVAKRMLESAREIPQFTVSLELDAGRLASRRARINADIVDPEKRASVTAALIWLTARALLEYPRLNARFDGDALLLHDTVNLAVAIDTPAGLVAPVIRQAEALSIHATVEALRDLAARAAAKRLVLSDFADATFTLSNLGMFGVSRFTPLVNPPQAAILGVAGVRTVARPDADGRLVPAQVMELTVTADHRVLDGAEVARFLRTLREQVDSEAWGEVAGPDACPPAP